MLSQFCIRRPIFASVMSIIIVIAGLIAGNVLPIAQYPDITPPSVGVSANYDGADAETLSRTVAAPIEDQLSGIEGLIYFETSLRSSGLTRISCTFDVGTDPNEAMLEINNRVRTAERALPDQVRSDGVSVRKRNNDILLMVSFFSPDNTLSDLDLADFVNLNITDEIKRIPGVGDVDTMGSSQSAMRIWLDPNKMAKLGVTILDIKSAVNEQNAQHAAGKIGAAPSIEEQQITYTMRSRGQLLTPAEFGQIIIRSNGPDGTVRLEDVARIEVGNRLYDAYNLLNDYRSATLSVYLQPGANSLKTAQLVKNELTELSKEFPDGVDYRVTGDTSLFVEAALSEVIQTLLEAAAIVLLVVYIFLQNWRATLIPMLAVPVSLIGTLAGLWVLNFSINTLTLFAMTLAIGIVVDDAIVVLENVERLMDTEGLTPLEASKKAMKEVSSALIAIVLVLSTVFTPVAFLGGMAGTLYRQFAVTIGVSVVLSGFVALTLTPALCAIILRPQTKEFVLFRWFNNAFNGFRNLFVGGVKVCIKYWWFTALTFIAACYGCYYFLEVTPTSFVPAEDQGFVRVSLQLPEGSALVRTGAFAENLSDEIRQLNGVLNTTTLVANDMVAQDTKPNTATIMVQLKPWKERTVTAEQIRQQVQRLIDEKRDGVGQALNPAPIPGLGRSGGLEFYLQSRDIADALVVQETTADFAARLREFPAVNNARSTMQADAPQLYVEVDENKALAMGVPISDLYNSIVYFLGGNYVNNFTRNGKSYRVYIQADAPYRADPQAFSMLNVRSDSGNIVPISSLVNVVRTSGPESLKKINGFIGSDMNIQAAHGHSTGELIQLVEDEARDLPSGFHVVWTGQAYQEKRIGSSSALAFAFGLIIVFLILAAQFERWSLPLAVVMAVPYAVLAALIATYFRGFDNDIYFQIGLLVLVGLSAKNAILIVEFASQLMEEGKGVFEAAVEAARLRLRPIVMTSLAFIFGVIPLAVATGAGAAARRSMGTGVVGGMLAATFITTFFIPVFFTWFVSRKKINRRYASEETT